MMVIERRKNLTHELPIYCPRCGNFVNEYNWTLEAAASRSEGDHYLPTLAYVLWRLLEGGEDIAAIDYVPYCPRCHEKVALSSLNLPSREQLLAYIEAVGEDYVMSQY